MAFFLSGRIRNIASVLQTSGTAKSRITWEAKITRPKENWQKCMDQALFPNSRVSRQIIAPTFNRFKLKKVNRAGFGA
jgi:hypothetical protein